MFKALFLSSVLAASFSVGQEIQTAEACGIKLGARSAPKIRAKSSSNPSRILVVGKKDSSLISKLKKARHKTEYATTVSDASRDKYDLVIADASQYGDARERFGNSQILQKKSSTKSTTTAAETLLARRAVQTSSKRSAPAEVKENRTPVKTGVEGVAKRSATNSGVEQPVAAPIVNRGTGGPAATPPVRVAVSTDVPSKPVAKVEVEPTVSKPKEVKPKATPRAEPKTVTRAEPKARALKWTRVVQFGTNKTNLSSASKNRLKKNAEWMSANPSASLVIEGHTDVVGAEDYNLELSERRANVARDILIGFGVDESRITVEAKGETEPAFTPATSGKNRRIVLIKQ